MFISPHKFNVFACEFVQVTRDITEMGDEFTIVTNKTEEVSYTSVIFLKEKGYSVTAFIFSGSIAMLPLETMCPRYSTDVVANSHFLSLQYYWC